MTYGFYVISENGFICYLAKDIGAWLRKCIGEHDSLQFDKLFKLQIRNILFVACYFISYRNRNINDGFDRSKRIHNLMRI